MERRSILKLVSGAIAAGLGAVLGVPAAIVLGFPIRHRTIGGADAPVDVASLGELPEGVPARRAVRAPRLRDAWLAFTDVTLGAVWLIRSGSSVQAFSTVCPHAGCAVDWDAEQRCFACPCHSSVFDADGKRRSGPTPRGLDTLDCTVDGNRVRVNWRRFRQGVRDKEEA
jgi:Rieske Fe-S protein